MTVGNVLDCLDAVRPRGAGRWSARCPAHQPDSTPSLSVSEGDRGILLTCFAGCTLEDICAALGIEIRSLFYDADRPRDPATVREAWRQRERERADREWRQQREGLQIDAAREAERLITSARGVDISDWDDARLTREQDRLADAYAVIEREGHCIYG